MLYKATLRALGSFSSPLQSDTFFGAFCWSYRYLYGTEALESFLEDMMIEPQVIFSNAFPVGTLPLPAGAFDEELILPGDAPREERQKSYQKGKQLKNARFIPVEQFTKIAAGHTAGFSAHLKDNGLTNTLQIHNMVDRSSGTVENKDGAGNLYTAEAFYASCGDFDLYCYIDEGYFTEKELKHILETMLLLGIGGKKSTGKGAFRLIDFSPVDFPKPPKANGFMALSDFMPTTEDPVLGRYHVFAKYPKVDREFSATEYPFKKPILLIEAGSVFLDATPKPFYGRCVDHISPLYDKIMINACTIPLPMTLK